MRIADYRLLIGVLIVLVVSGILISFPHTEAGISNQEIYPINSKPYGLTYGEWTAKWWQWAYSMPTIDNPTVDETGAKCSLGQNDTNVWFLAGTGGGKVSRSCTIPAEKAILFPIINVECDYLSTPEFKTESDLRECAKADQDKATNLQATIDGVDIPDLKKYRVQSPLFNITLPTDNAPGLPAGIMEAVSDGYWILLKPLPLGNHKIHFTGSIIDYTATGPLNFVSDAEYDITIANP
jgi:hypothetical protein